MAQLPREGELAIAVVKKIMPYGAFCTLSEYGDMEAFMHVSEVAPRWIKNIHEFLSEKQKLVVKVHRVDAAKGQVDVSLKRVNEDERKRKVEGVKKETRAVKLLQVALKNSKSKKTFDALKTEITAEYGNLYDFLESVRDEGDAAFEGLDIDKALKKELEGMVVKYVKKPVTEIAKVLKITCYEPDGMHVVKTVLEGADAHYLGAGRYMLRLETEDPKAGEKEMGKRIAAIEKSMKGKDCTFSVEEAK
ncbi:MAG: S1 RNA-binding domain-containing protein [Candidatus ainarchaeum sp.]|nr:S1 RNA-binding domain-containing protein [Candidatus ainarchaeum sp.]MDD5096309.1 S1 RNA-binding domain-containing protein [Candidatus ainarchaeum sp.]